MYSMEALSETVARRHDRGYRLTGDEVAESRTGHESRFTLSNEFWVDFVENYWEKKPLVIKQPFARPLATPEEAFDALVRAADTYRGGDRTFETRFYVEDLLMMKGVGAHLPDWTDGSIEGYERRVTRQLRDRKFELIVGHVQAQTADLWMRLRDFFRPLYESIGRLPENPEAVVFLRNYKSTSRGIHKDTAGVFAFVIERAKRMIVWPYEVFRDRAGTVASLDSELFLDSATILEGEPGDVLYWPASYWHVGETDGGLSLSINVGLELNYKPMAMASSYLSQIAGEVCGSRNEAVYAFDPDRLQEISRSLPDAFSRAAQALSEAARSVELERSLKLAWLNRVTGCGFIKVPPPRPVEMLSDDEIVRGNRDYPVVSIPWGEDKIAVSANGHSFSASSSAAVMKLIDRLNTGEPHSIKNLIIESVATESVEEHEYLRSVIEKLYSLRAATPGQ
jgi:50S ribosomal protein L16 3-hydroxylase